MLPHRSSARQHNKQTYRCARVPKRVPAFLDIIIWSPQHPGIRPGGGHQLSALVIVGLCAACRGAGPEAPPPPAPPQAPLAPTSCSGRKYVPRECKRFQVQYTPNTRLQGTHDQQEDVQPTASSRAPQNHGTPLVSYRPRLNTPSRRHGRGQEHIAQPWSFRCRQTIRISPGPLPHTATTDTQHRIKCRICMPLIVPDPHNHERK